MKFSRLRELAGRIDRRVRLPFDRVEGRVVCDRCRREMEARRPPVQLIDPGIEPLTKRR
jgi:hypothetical protein